MLLQSDCALSASILHLRAANVDSYKTEASMLADLSFNQGIFIGEERKEKGNGEDKQLADHL